MANITAQDLLMAYLRHTGEIPKNVTKEEAEKKVKKEKDFIDSHICICSCSL